MAAFKTCANEGLIPQAKHGGRGVWTFAAAESKLTGIGFEKLHIVHTHVAVVICGGSDGGRYALSPTPGDAVLVLAGEAVVASARLCRADRFKYFGNIVILGDDLKNPA